MFTQQLPPELFQVQREFIRVMKSNLDFVWAAKALVVEETKELKEAYAAAPSEENLKHIFKELADVIYVVAYFYNVMPAHAPELLDKETNENLQRIMDEAAVVVSEVCNTMKIPLPILVAAFEEVHRSNMTKVNPETGKPDRREDGKILKGPNYEPADMAAAVNAWKTFLKENQHDQTSDG